MPVILALLVFAFGSVVAALLPLAIGVIAILGTFAELFVLGSVTNVAIYAINLTTALGLALAIDYALLMVSRFREELGRGQEPARAVVRSVQTAGRTIVFSGATVVAALAVLLIFPLYFLRSFAYAGIGVVLISMAAAVVVLPALLAVLGRRVNSGRLPWARGREPSTAAPFWGRLAGQVMRRPALLAIPVLAVLMLVALPLRHVGFGTPDDRVLPATTQSRAVGDVLREDFTGNSATALNVVTDGPLDRAALTAYATRLSGLAGVARVETSVATFVHGNAVPDSANPTLARPTAQRLSVVSAADPRSTASKDLVRTVRDLPSPDGVRVYVGGDTAELIDTTHAIGTRLPLAALLIVLTTFIVLFLFTGSVVQPIRSLVLNGVTHSLVTHQNSSPVNLLRASHTTIGRLSASWPFKSRIGPVRKARAGYMRNYSANVGAARQQAAAAFCSFSRGRCGRSTRHRRWFVNSLGRRSPSCSLAIQTATSTACL